MAIRNLAIVWILTGIWHGANCTYLIWGIWHGLWIIIEKMTGIASRKEKNRIRDLLHRFITIIVVVIGWVFFRSDNVNIGFKYVLQMFSFSSLVVKNEEMLIVKDAAVITVIALIGATPLIKKAFAINYVNLAVPVLSAIVLLISFSFIMSSNYDPFIYFNF